MVNFIYLYKKLVRQNDKQNDNMYKIFLIENEKQKTTEYCNIKILY